MSLPTGLLEQILSAFPPVQHAFGYGSGVFHQPVISDGDRETTARYDLERFARSERPQLDFILAVDDPIEWHRQNLALHRSHYSLIASLGPEAVVAVAERLGVAVYFNTLVPWGTRYIKYGVVSLPTLERDLRQWDSLYCAGRLQKPVMTLREDARVAAAQGANLLSALRVALLLLPERFSTEDLLHTICALSYMGDLRVGLAEDSRKVHRIVQGSSTALQELYRGPLRAAESAWGNLRSLHPSAPLDAQQRQRGGSGAERGQQRLEVQQQEREWEGGGLAWGWEQDRSEKARRRLVEQLPWALLHRMARSANASHAAAMLRQEQGGGAAEVAAALLAPSQRHPLSWHVRHAVRSVVWRSSFRQLVAGFLSAGAAKSARYALSKLRKAWR